MYHSSSFIAIQKNKRLALKIAENRMELIRRLSYKDVRPHMNSDQLFYMYWHDVISEWVHEVTPKHEIKIMNDRSFSMTTTVQHMKLVGYAKADLQYVRCTVSVQYRANPSESVTLQTYRSP